MAPQRRRFGALFIMRPKEEECLLGAPFDTRLEVEQNELLIGGAGVSLGYWRRPELTESRFERGRFRTGDLVEVQNDEIFCLGRLDEMVKLNGFRIELGEVEQVLISIPAVERAAVEVRENLECRVLVAYLVLKEVNFGWQTQITSFLRQHLPEYMVPQRFVKVASLPMTLNGKLDRKLLPKLLPDPVVPVVPVACELGLREAVLQALEDVLGTALPFGSPFGSSEEWRDLGLNSSMAVAFSAHLARRLHRSVHPSAIFQHPTVSKLVAFLEGPSQVASQVSQASQEMDKVVRHVVSLGSLCMTTQVRISDIVTHMQLNQLDCLLFIFM